jgi:creatinine amidohydrolase/Fe(II)-dependent formamide hydrolase-like protein
MKRLAMSMLLPVTLALPLVARAQKAPDTVRLEELTWEEVRDLIRAGKTSVIIGTAGTEQKGPHMVMGEHRFVLEYTTDRIARALGNALVAPVITYVPEGSWENPRGHMRMAGTITLPNDRFMVLLENAGKSLQAGGFTDIIYIGDSGGNQDGMRQVATKLNEEWKGTGSRAHFIGDYYTKSGADSRKYLMEKYGVAESDIGSHAGMLDTSEMMAVNPSFVRKDRFAPNGGGPNSGVSGDPTKASVEIGHAILKIKIDNAVAQIKSSLVAPMEKKP